MAIEKHDIGEVLFGAAVTGAEWWDNKRVTEGTLKKKDFYKKAGFYTYLIIGGGCTLATAFGKLLQYDEWTTRIAHGFLYDLPRVGLNTINSLRTTTGGGSSAVAEANRILRERQAAAGRLAAGRETARTYEQEFATTGVV